MLLADIAVTSAVSVGPMLPSVRVWTSDRLPLLLIDIVGKGCAEGLPDFSNVVCTVYYITCQNFRGVVCFGRSLKHLSFGNA